MSLRRTLSALSLAALWALPLAAQAVPVSFQRKKQIYSGKFAKLP